jgi:hypothetical protein
VAKMRRAVGLIFSSARSKLDRFGHPTSICVGPLEMPLGFYLGAGGQGVPSLEGGPCGGCDDPAHHCMCSVQVVDIILIKVPFHKYHIPKSCTTETLWVRNFTCSKIPTKNIQKL